MLAAHLEAVVTPGDGPRLSAGTSYIVRANGPKSLRQSAARIRPPSPAALHQLHAGVVNQKSSFVSSPALAATVCTECKRQIEPGNGPFLRFVTTCEICHDLCDLSLTSQDVRFY